MGPEHVEKAAEITLERHLGITLRSVAGLVQLPCIERKPFSAVKAIAAASLVFKCDAIYAMQLDACIESMCQTGLDMRDD